MRSRRSVRHPRSSRATSQKPQDYAGETVDMIDAGTGEVPPAQIFVAATGASNCTHTEATFTGACPIGSARMSGRSPSWAACRRS
jgi:hypothetical protein